MKSNTTGAAGYHSPFVLIGGPSAVPTLGEDPHTYSPRSLTVGLSFALSEGWKPVQVMRLVPLEPNDVVSRIQGWMTPDETHRVESDQVIPYWPDVLETLGGAQLLAIEPDLYETLLAKMRELWAEVTDLLKAADMCIDQVDFADMGIFGIVTDEEILSVFHQLTNLDTDPVLSNAALYMALLPCADLYRLRAWLVGTALLPQETQA